MKAKTLFTILGLIHVLVGLALVGMLLNGDEALKQWITSTIPEDIKTLITGQLRVVIAHSVGVGLVMLAGRNISNTADARRLLRGYCLFSALVIANAVYGLLFATAPPMVIFGIYIAGFVLALWGSMNAIVPKVADPQEA